MSYQILIYNFLIQPFEESLSVPPQVAGLPGVTEALFQARQLALAEEKGRSDEGPMSYSCVVCEKEYRSSKALDQHLKSKSHIIKVSQGPAMSSQMTTVKPLTARPSRGQTSSRKQDEDGDSEDEWVEVDSTDDVNESSVSMGIDVDHDDAVDDEGMDEDFDTSCCFICDEKHQTIESCTVHMHKQHGFFIPDVEYLKDVKGFLTYLGLKVNLSHIFCFPKL